MRVKLDKAPRIRVAYVQIEGPYEQWGKRLMELVSLLDSRKVQINGAPFGRYYDSPLDTPVEKLRSEACIPIKGRVAASTGVKVKQLEAAMMATTVHEGPPERYTDTYGALFGWIIANGYEFYGPAMEIFPLPSENLRPGMGTEIQQPIRKAKKKKR